MKNILIATGIVASAIFCFGLRKSYLRRTATLEMEETKSSSRAEGRFAKIPRVDPRRALRISQSPLQSSVQRRQIAAQSETLDLRAIQAEALKQDPRDAVARGRLRHVKNNNYDPRDSEMLKQLIYISKQQGTSRVAYVGELPELFAVDPRFFETTVNAQGKPTLELRAIESVENDKTIQLEAYALPSTGTINYQNINDAIIHATNDGAMLVNLTSPHISRSNLAAAIRYARDRGVVVTTIRPPGLR